MSRQPLHLCLTCSQFNRLTIILQLCAIIRPEPDHAFLSYILTTYGCLIASVLAGLQ